MAVILCLSISLGLLGRIFALEPLPIFQPFYGAVPEGVEIISADQAQGFYQEGGSLFVDAREWERYNTAHIPGAINIPADQFTQRDVTSSLRTARFVIVYCEDVHCGASRKLLTLLAEEGVRDLVLMPEGFRMWDQSGYPVVRATHE
jgi:rhodanese-related sulfurtransferase